METRRLFNISIVKNMGVFLIATLPTMGLWNFARFLDSAQYMTYSPYRALKNHWIANWTYMIMFTWTPFNANVYRLTLSYGV